MLLGGVLVGMGLPFSYSIKDNNIFFTMQHVPGLILFFASDEVMVFCLRLFFISQGNPHLCVYMNIYIYMVL